MFNARFLPAVLGAAALVISSPSSFGQAPAGSVPLVKEGLSPSFSAVASHLELGGESFTYNDMGDAASVIAEVLDAIIKAVPEDQRRDIPKDFSAAKAFEAMGFNSVKASGFSSRKNADGSYHSRSFVYTPNGRKGLITLTGSEAKKLMLLEVAPKDTDFAIELPLNLRDVVRDVLSMALETMKGRDRQQLEEQLKQPFPGMNLTLRQVMEKFDGRIGIYMVMDPASKIPVPIGGKPQEIPSMNVAIVIERLGWLFEALKPQFMPMLQDPSAPVTIKDEGGVLTISMKQPAGPPPMDYMPVLRFDTKADRLILTSRPQLMTEMLAGNGGFTGREDFGKVWKDLPQEGNACVFISSRILSLIPQLVGDAAETEMKTPGEKAVMDKIMDWIKPSMSRSQALVVTNQKDGIQALANASVPVNPASIGTVYTVAVLAGLAVPAFTQVQVKAKQTQLNSQARMIVISLKSYAIDHNGNYPAQLNDLIKAGLMEDPSQIIFKDPDTGLSQGWDYTVGLTDSSSGTAILLASPVVLKGGKRIVAFNDGSVQVMDESEYQKLKARN